MVALDNRPTGGSIQLQSAVICSLILAGFATWAVVSIPVPSRGGTGPLNLAFLALFAPIAIWGWYQAFSAAHRTPVSIEVQPDRMTGTFEPLGIGPRRTLSRTMLFSSVTGAENSRYYGKTNFTPARVTSASGDVWYLQGYLVEYIGARWMAWRGEKPPEPAAAGKGSAPTTLSATAETPQPVGEEIVQRFENWRLR